MGFDLRPRNKKAGELSVGAFTWLWMLESGIGWPVGYGCGMRHGEFVWSRRPDDRCLQHNDGARVSASEAKDMAKAARWIASYQDSLWSVWIQETESFRLHMQQNPQLYRMPVRRDVVEKARAFADWAERSGGFRVY